MLPLPRYIDEADLCANFFSAYFMLYFPYCQILAGQAAKLIKYKSACVGPTNISFTPMQYNGINPFFRICSPKFAYLTSQV
jgi:hypothetical protein